MVKLSHGSSEQHSSKTTHQLMKCMIVSDHDSRHQTSHYSCMLGLCHEIQADCCLYTCAHIAAIVTNRPEYIIYEYCLGKLVLTFIVFTRIDFCELSVLFWGRQVLNRMEGVLGLKLIWETTSRDARTVSYNLLYYTNGVRYLHLKEKKKKGGFKKKMCGNVLQKCFNRFIELFGKCALACLLFPVSDFYSLSPYR